jgi:hypothetical protein
MGDGGPVFEAVQSIIPGGGAFIYRTSTSTVSFSATTTLLGSSFFGHTKYSTADITVDLTNNEFTVTTPGLYVCVLRIQCGGTQPLGSSHLTPLLYKNGAVDTWGAEGWGTASDGTSAQSVWSMFPVLLAAADYVQPGYNCTFASGAFTGEATGVKTYFSISAASRSGF